MLGTESANPGYGLACKASCMSVFRSASRRKTQIQISGMIRKVLAHTTTRAQERASDHIRWRFFRTPLGLRANPASSVAMMDPVASLRTAQCAGTPDYAAPQGVSLCTIGHYAADVMPFGYCPLDTYLKYRPPNNGNNCPGNP